MCRQITLACCKMNNTNEVVHALLESLFDTNMIFSASFAPLR